MIFRILLSLLAMSIIYSAVPNDLLANGSGRQIHQGIAGEFLVTARMHPSTPRPGIMHFTVELADMTTNAPITDASVKLYAEGNYNFGTAGPAIANNSLENTNFYDANLNFDHEGAWTLTIEIDSPIGWSSLNIPLNLQSRYVPAKMWIMLAAFFTFLVAMILFLRSKNSNGRFARR